jgi:hypothetical protein
MTASTAGPARVVERIGRPETARIALVAAARLSR